MGRVNSFNPEYLKNDKIFNKLQNIDKITLLFNNDQKDFMKKYFELEDVDDFKLIGLIEINKILKTKIEEERKDFIFLISDNNYKEMFVSIGQNSKSFWYKFTSKKGFFENFDKFYKTYNKEVYEKNYSKKCRGFVGTEKMLDLTIFDIENHLIVNPNTEILIWGSKWSDNPFRKIYMERSLTKYEDITYSIQAMKQL